MNNANDNGKQKVVTSLRDLPQAVQPPRDLWASIESQITAAQKPAVVQRSTSRNPGNLRWMAAAAVIAALAVGMWIGRSMLPVAGTANQPPMTARSDDSQGNTGQGNTNQGQGDLNGGATTFQAAYSADPKFRQTREALLKTLDAKLNSLPPDSRQKVISSLATIHQCMQDLEAALGKDPTNALLQELLLNTYQDEMRVLTTVHEAGTAGEGI
jgi:hypothetical protein